MTFVLRRLRTLENLVGRAEELLGMLLVAALAIVVNLQIFSRYLFHAPFIWPEEVARLLLVWIAFIGAAAMTRRGADIAVDTFVLLLPDRLRRAFLLFRDVVMVVLFGFISMQGVELARAVAGMPLIATGMPTAMLAWPLLACGVLTVFHCLSRIVTLVLTGEAPAHEIQVHT